MSLWGHSLQTQLVNKQPHQYLMPNLSLSLSTETEMMSDPLPLSLSLLFRLERWVSDPFPLSPLSLSLTYCFLLLVAFVFFVLGKRAPPFRICSDYHVPLSLHSRTWCKAGNLFHADQTGQLKTYSKPWAFMSMGPSMKITLTTLMTWYGSDHPKMRRQIMYFQSFFTKNTHLGSSTLLLKYRVDLIDLYSFFFLLG